MVRLLERCAPKSHHRIADVFVERALSVEDDASHVGEIAVEEEGEVLGVQGFGDGSEVADIAEHDGDVGLARLHQLRAFEEAANDFGTQVLLEAAANFAFFSLFDDDAIERDEAELGNHREEGNGQVEPPAFEKSGVNAAEKGRGEPEAEPHVLRAGEREPKTKGHTEEQDKCQIRSSLTRAAMEEILVPFVVEDRNS